MAYLLLVLYSAINGGIIFFQKRYNQKAAASNNTGETVYILFIGLFSLFTFWAAAGGKIITNPTIILFAFIYSFACVLSEFTVQFSYGRVNIVLYSIFSKLGTVVSWVLGITMFHERLTIWNISSVLLIIAAVLLPLHKFKNEKKVFIPSCIIGVVTVCSSVLSTITLKTYFNINWVDTSHITSMFFYTNGFMAIISAIVLFFKFLHNKEATKTEMSFIPVSVLAYIFIVCILNAPLSLINAYVMKELPLATYSILMSALGGLVVFINSKVFFNEKADKTTVTALIITSVAAILGAF